MLQENKRGARFELANYCSTDCQQMRWRTGHKHACRKEGEIKKGDFMWLEKLVLNQETNFSIVKVARRVSILENLNGETLDEEQDDEERCVIYAQNKEVNVPAKNLFRLRPEM